MKLNVLAVLTAASLAVGATSAHAISASETPDLTIFLAGAAGLITNYDLTMGVPVSLTPPVSPGTKVCQAGTVTKFVDPSAAGTNMIAYFCRSSIAGIQGKKILIYFRGNGGSIFGIDPVGSYEIGRYSISAAACGTETVSPVKCTTWVTPATPNSGYTTQIPDLGVSLSEPGVFLSPSPNIDTVASNCVNTMFTDPCPQGNGTPGVLTSTPILVQATVIGANKALWDALQAQQGLSGNQVPTLTRAEAASLFGERNALSNRPSSPNWSNLSNEMAGRFAGPTFNGPMQVCRGRNGLGTVAALNAVLLHNPCSTGAPLGAAPMVVTSKPGFTVTQSATVNQVLANCLGAQANAGVKTIGLLTLDQISTARAGNPNATPPVDPVYMLNIEGAPLSDANTINNTAVQYGIYDLWTEVTFQIANGVAANDNLYTLALGVQDALQTTTPGPGVYNIQGLGTSRPMFVTRGGNSCAPFQH